MNHAFLPIGFAFRTRHLACMAANTPLHVDKKFHILVVLSGHDCG
jgi:hypothetical protein